MKELPVTWKSSAGLTWALVWRLFLVAIPFTIIESIIPQTSKAWLVVYSAFSILGFAAVWVFVVHWLRLDGYGGLIIVLREKPAAAETENQEEAG